MNRQEALDWLYRISCSVRTRMFDVPKLWYGSVIEALGVAINSLETDEAYQLEYEQPEFCADCISRAEVLKLMKDNWHTHNGDWAMQESMDDIRALPSVYPKSDKHFTKADLDAVVKAIQDDYAKRLEDIKAEIENMLSDGMVHKKTIIGIIDNHISGK